MLASDLAMLQRLIGELEGVWVEVGDSATLDRLRPGLPPEVIRSTTAGLPLTLPDEAVAWFAWHDGGETDAGSGPPIGASFMEFFTLDWAINTYRWKAEFAAETAFRYTCTKAEAGWDPAWFPLFAGSNGTTAAIDCSVGPGQAAPIRMVGKGDEDPERIDFDSLSDLLAGWIRLYRVGAYEWCDGTWQVDRLSVDWDVVGRRMNPVF